MWGLRHVSLWVRRVQGHGRGEGGGVVDMDVNVDTHAVWHVCRVRAHWVHVGGAGNVVMGLEHVHWGCSECARGRAV